MWAHCAWQQGACLGWCLSMCDSVEGFDIAWDAIIRSLNILLDKGSGSGSGSDHQHNRPTLSVAIGGVSSCTFFVVWLLHNCVITLWLFMMMVGHCDWLWSWSVVAGDGWCGNGCCILSGGGRMLNGVQGRSWMEGTSLDDDDNYCCHASLFVAVINHCLSWCMVWVMAAGWDFVSWKGGGGGCWPCGSNHSFPTSQLSLFIAIVVAASVHRSSSLDQKNDWNGTEPNCKRPDHWLQLHKFWKFSAASCKVFWKIERPKKTSLSSCHVLDLTQAHICLIFSLWIIKDGQELVEIWSKIFIHNLNGCPFCFHHISAKS